MIFRKSGRYGFAARELPWCGVPKNMIAVEGFRMYFVYSSSSVMSACARECLD